jgi:hypothetical protein
MMQIEFLDLSGYIQNDGWTLGKDFFGYAVRLARIRTDAH